ncbi:VPLPA-CTERM sorting domain-containing protein [Methylomonas sp. LL1]|uniref:VPLPA-CTERM sorting domain-containing protein n=1 Tax=Methylomonas sp. LL1 TaxID=2785785 RepID=UPI0018C36207|nr:VPLPA-CTERM sorting domain-containing protein [Methylomonas sp. LL1]
MKTSHLAAMILAAQAMNTTASASVVLPGGTLADLAIAGTTSIYHVFGHAGNPGGDSGSDTPAIRIDFNAGANNVFSISATGLVGCCSDSPNITPDGGNSSAHISGTNGLSGILGNAQIALVGVFTSEIDPFGSVAPVSLSFDAANPISLSPLLAQVFYIGDGKSGKNNPSGTALTFTAPTNASRLYLGLTDGWAFNGLPGYYGDNRGAFTANVSLAPVPLPAALPLMLTGLGALGLASRRKQEA